MKNIDVNNLFSLFEVNDESIYKEHNEEQHLDNPFVLMGMVLTGLQNYYMMDMMYKRNYPERYERVSKTLKLKYYTRLFSYLSSIDTTSFSKGYTIGESYSSDDVFLGLEVLRVYFESIEDYEKCKVIKDYIDLLLENVTDLKRLSI